MKNPWLAMTLSLLLPGLGQLYLNERAKGISMLFISIGIAVSLAVSRSAVAYILIGPLYLFALVPAAVDAYQTASGKPRTFKGESVFYVIIMLFAVGPFAIPLLWQSPRFSKSMKIVLTAFVTLVALAAILTMTMFASTLDKMIRQDTAALSL
jgi:TM2 domain-containing membrane protein YozV